MKTIPAIVALLALAAFVPSVHASGVTVTLELAAGSYVAPASKSCTVTVPAGANAGDVLDAATATGCISGWEHSDYPGYGRFVSCIDGTCQIGDGLVTYWEYVENGVIADHGIDAYQAFAGDHVKFVYTNFGVDLVVAPVASLLP